MTSNIHHPNVQFANSGVVIDSRLEHGDDELKIWILARKDLNLSTGKWMAQAAHAAGLLMNQAGDINEYIVHGQAKIVVGVNNKAQLDDIIDEVFKMGINACLVKDSARTELDISTYTCGAIGPCRKSQLPKSVTTLRLF
jgi:PTH2 family peptidyl-tRNA hydrolase